MGWPEIPTWSGRCGTPTPQQVGHDPDLSFMSNPGYYASVAAFWATRSLPDQVMLGAASRATAAVGRRALVAAGDGTDLRAARLAAEEEESGWQRNLLRDIIGNVRLV